MEEFDKEFPFDSIIGKGLIISEKTAPDIRNFLRLLSERFYLLGKSDLKAEVAREVERMFFEKSFRDADPEIYFRIKES